MRLAPAAAVLALMAVLPILADPPGHFLRTHFGQLCAQSLHLTHRIVAPAPSDPGA